jgi:hypothetical protein
MKRYFSLLAGLAFATAALAQEPSRGNAATTIGGKKVTVNYGRPALKGRDMSELLKQLPADRMWRAGENQVTILTTEGDLLVGGKKVPAGRYSLYVHAPASGDWSLALNSDQGIALGKIWDKAPANLKDEPWPHLQDYSKNVAQTEVLRAPMKSGTASPAAENFTVTFAPASDGANMILAWGTNSWSIEVKPAK